MTDEMPFTGEPVDSHEAIMRATFYALQEHGYAGLSIQRIADEADLSKSTFYHHFDGKDDLLLSFLEFILEEFDRVFQLETSDDPAADLRTFFAIVLGQYDFCEEIPAVEEFLEAYVELRAQAVRNAEYRAKFTETDEAFTERISALIEMGIERGVFAETDPDRTAQFLMSTLDGVILQNSTRNDSPQSAMYDAIDDYIENTLLAE
ncbi:TetR/AcrR family transcriptional regulator [Halomicroarcula limicola]|uniref:TetR/AcrR family transcriptional regulator n=1 Tax=Haloarcula limicola TaxID=1429915 RepID=A0A8J7Y576_9EURY|nr:TetR/AcrR family transcriptional regulator [Halomicroarcula limicola]MBV0924960.1 TetR/AcrR family transcriptional regulator [Halomicroarcula limicola]